MQTGELPLDDLLARLDLPNTQHTWRDTTERAANEGWSYQEFLAVLLVQELNFRQVSRLHRLCREAQFPFQKTSEDFDFAQVSACCKEVIKGYMDQSFVAAGRSLLLVGPEKSGKTHLAVAIAYQGIQNGFDALYTTAGRMLQELDQAVEQGRWREGLARFTRPDVLIVDEIDETLPRLDRLYLVLNERYAARRSVILATRTPPGQWALPQREQMLLASILEQVIERGQILHLEIVAEDPDPEPEVLSVEDLASSLPPPPPLETLDRTTPPAPQPPRVSGVQERRVHRRYSANFEVNATSNHNFFTGFCQDISEGGIFLATHDIRPVGELVDLQFSLPCGHTVRTAGIVRWQRVCATEEGAWPGIGVEFLALSPEDLRAIQAFFAQREPLFHV
jgi:uncharacterized protein (TIGR02266 family)